MEPSPQLTTEAKTRASLLEGHESTLGISSNCVSARYQDGLQPHGINSTVRHAALLLSMVGAATISWPSLHTLFIAGRDADQYTYTLLVLPVSIVLIVARLKATAIVAPNTSTTKMFAVLALMLIGLATWRMLATETCDLPINICVLVLCWFGLLMFSYGIAVFSQLLFPLLLAFLMVPFLQRSSSGWCTCCRLHR